MVKGENSREWIYVKDHCEALIKFIWKVKLAIFIILVQIKNLNNIQVTKSLINISKNKIKVGKKVKILFVKDRPGHDIRYALNSNKIKNELGWRPNNKFWKGIKYTFNWYYENEKYFKSLSKKDIIKRLGKKW